MTSPNNPDIAAAPDLFLHRVDERDIFDAELAGVKAKLPTWDPSELDVEVVILEGVAPALGQVIYTLNRIPRVLLEALFTEYGVARKQGAAGQARIRVRVAAGLSGQLQLPGGSRFRLTLDDTNTIDMLTVETINLNPVDGYGFVTAEAESTGTLGNGTPSGTEVIGVGVPGWIDYSELWTGGFAGGTDQEDDAAFYARGGLEIRRRPAALNRGTHFEAFALAQENIARAHSYDRWDGTASLVTTDLGWITVVVVGAGGLPLSGGDMSDLETLMSDQAQSGLQINVLNATLTDYTVTATVLAGPGVDHATLKTQLEANLHAWLNPLTWQWNRTLTANDLIVQLGRQPGVDAVTATGGASIGDVPGAIELPAVTSSITVTVT